MTLAVAGTAITTPAVAADPDELLVRDEFSRTVAEGWGVPAVGSRWMYPTGRSGLHVASGAGVMEHWKRATPRLMTIESSVRDATIDLTFSLDRVPLASGVKVMTVARKSTAGQYRAGVRIGAQGKVWLSLAKARNGGDAKSLGEAVAVAGLRYRAGDRLRLKAQVIRQDPTQLRAKVWPAGTSEPATWQLVRSDGSDDVGRGGNVGVRSVMTEGETASSITVRVDRITVNRAQDSAKTTTPKATPKPSPKATPKATPKPTPKATPKPTPKATPKPTTAPANAVNVPSSVDATGRTNAQPALQKLINNARNGSTIVFKAGGTYRIDKGVWVHGKRNITLDGNGATIKLPTQDHGFEGIGFHVSNSTGTTIRDFTIVGNNSTAGTKNTFKSRTNNHAIAVLSSDDTLIERVDIRKPWGACLYVRYFNTQYGDWSEGVTFRDSSCRLTGNAAVSMKGARDVLIEDNQFDQIGYMIMNIEMGKGHEGADGVVLRNNTIGSYSLTDAYRGFLLASCDSPWNTAGSDVRNVTVTGNTIAGNRRGNDGAMTGLHVRICGDRGTRVNYTVKNNVAKSTVAGPAMTFIDVKGVTVTGNTQPLSKGELATFPGSTNVTKR